MAEQAPVGPLGVLDSTGAMLYRLDNGHVTGLPVTVEDDVLTLVDIGAGVLQPRWQPASLAVKSMIQCEPSLAIFEKIDPDGGGAVNNPSPKTAGTNPVLAFDANTDDGIAWQKTMPLLYDGADVTVKVYWALDSGSVEVGDVGWQVALERNNAGNDLGTDNFAALTAVVATAAGAADIEVVTTITVTGPSLAAIAAGDPFRFYIQRDVSVANNLDDDANVVRVTIAEA